MCVHVSLLLVDHLKLPYKKHITKHIKTNDRKEEEVQ